MPFAFRGLYLGLLALPVAFLSTNSEAMRSAPPAFSLPETTIAQTEAALQAGILTCHELVQGYLERIAAYDQPTHLNTVVTLNPQVFADADRLDREFAATGKLRPLHCIAVAVKDNYDTAGLQTTGGSLAMKGVLPTDDAFMVKKLREAGAIVLFKSNMAEWAFSPVVTESSIAGLTRNPYDLSRVPAGSSGGTGAAVAANFAEVGLGTDTGDSIRGPASHNDLVGIRPTLGLTSRDGIVPLFLTADTGGPLARTVADAAAVLSAVAGIDPADPLTASATGHIEADYTKYLVRDGLRGARIGVFRRFIDDPKTDPEIKALTGQAVAEIKAGGATIVDPVDLPDYDKLTGDLGCGDFQGDLNQYLTVHAPKAPFGSLQAIYDSGLYLPYIKAEMEDALNRGKTRENPATPCQDVWHDPKKIAFRKALLAAMDGAHLDALLYPTWSNAPRKIGDRKTPDGDNNQVLSPESGFPAITVPMGFTHGTLPAGLQLLGRPWSEGLLFKLAFSYEQATHHRRQPAGFEDLPR